MNTPQPNSIRIDFTNSPDLRSLFANCAEGDSITISADFTLLRKDENTLDGALTEICKYEGEEREELEPSGDKPVTINIVVNSTKSSEEAAKESPSGGAENEMAYVAP